jgi:hypothetical protein
MDQELKCNSCIHDDVCYQVSECLCYIPGFTCNEYIPRTSGKIAININNGIKVKLTDFGRSILDKEVDRLKQVSGVSDNYTPYETDDSGYTEFQLWQFMNFFGEYLYNGATQVIENNEILVKVD